MEDLNLAPADLAVDSLGQASFPSPLQLSTEMGDGIANYVAEGSTVLIHQDRDEVLARLAARHDLPAFEAAGPGSASSWTRRRPRPPSSRAAACARASTMSSAPS